MRDILFRGKRVDNGEWVYGNLIVRKESDGCACGGKTFIDSGKPFDTAVEVNPETVGQYTGMDDIHGEKIFEWDIVMVEDFESEFVVEFFRHKAEFRQVYADGHGSSAMWSGFRYKRCGTVFDAKI